MGGFARLRFLLDTHIWLWSLHDPARLGKRVLHELRNPQNELWLSPISTWEALILSAKGRIRLPDDLAGWVAQATAPLREAPLTHEIALAARQLSLLHSDPADRFLAATAQLLHLTLITADLNLLGLGEISTLANR
jgi:PIN domain nuclease of toxin-antitoxin system